MRLKKGTRIVPQSYIEDVQEGQVIAWTETFSQFYTWLVCLLHLDFNPVHWNWIRARKTKFGRTIVHAISLWGEISRYLAKSYPGVAWIRCETDMLAPVPHGVEVTFTATVTRVESNKAFVEVHASVGDQLVLRTLSKISSKKKP